MTTAVVTYEGFTTLVVERVGHVGWLIFDRPDRGNAIDAVMFTELERAWQVLDADPEVRVIVNTGNGKAFQTGQYELVFFAGDYLRASGGALPDPLFLDEIPIRFGMAEAVHYHVPLLISPYGYSTYRGS